MRPSVSHKSDTSPAARDPDECIRIRYIAKTCYWNPTLPLSPFSSIDTRALTSDGDQQVAGLYQGASMSTTVLGYHVRRVVSGGSVTRTMHFKVEGRWADDYPEAS